MKEIFVLAESPVQCGRGIPDEEYEASCYVYSHTYNNMITEGSAFDNGANFLYSDMSVARNTYERNIFYGTEEGGALKNNCGKLNMGINNIIHRTSTLEVRWRLQHDLAKAQTCSAKLHSTVVVFTYHLAAFHDLESSRFFICLQFIIVALAQLRNSHVTDIILYKS